MAANVRQVIVPKIGADPEVFVFEGGVPRSAIGLIGGEKHDPRRVDKGALQEDNVLAEFNIDPADNEEEFVNNIGVVMNILRGVLPQGMSLGTVASHEFDVEYLRQQGSKAMEFGCDPDYNAYTLAANRMPEGVPPGLRTAGGHVHVGYTTTEDVHTAAHVARYLDVFLGVPSVLLDNDSRRRLLYGGAGCFRTKSYGMEYRTLSNFWLHDEALTRWVYRNAVLGAQTALSSPSSHDYVYTSVVGAEVGRVPCEVVARCISTNDKALAKRIVERCGITMPEGYTA